MASERLRFHAAHVADIAAAIGGGVRVEDFLVPTRAGQSHPVAVKHNR